MLSEPVSIPYIEHSVRIAWTHRITEGLTRIVSQEVTVSGDRSYPASSPETPAESVAGGTLSLGVAEDAYARRLGRMREWIIEHDDSKLFLVLYIGLAVVLSIWVSLFWLVAVVAVHFAFEVIRHSQQLTRTRDVVLESLWELKLDIALVLFALVLTLYMTMVLGVVGLQGAARIGAASRVATKFAGWERTLRGLLLSIDDAAQVVRATTMRQRGAASVDVQPVARSRWGSWAGPYTTGAWIAIGLGVACTVLILVAPWLTHHTAATAFVSLAAELRPLP